MTRSPSTADRFEALLRPHRGIVLKVAGLYARHPEDRRDLVQEIHAQAWHAFARRLADDLAGRSLMRALAHVEEARRFEEG